MLAKDFAVVKLDGARSHSADEAAKRLAIREPSIPLFSVTDASGKVLITSDGPLGNIGLASTVEGIRHFRKNLESSTHHMTHSNIDDLVQSLEERRKWRCDRCLAVPLRGLTTCTVRSAFANTIQETSEMIEPNSFIERLLFRRQLAGG
jgi:hypothetical protein